MQTLLIPDAQRQWREFFGAKLTAVVEVDDQFRYAWIEQALDPETGGLMDADPARQGTTTSGYALELNNAEVSVGTQPIVMMRVRAGWNDDVVYEFCNKQGGNAIGFVWPTGDAGNGYLTGMLAWWLDSPSGGGWGFLHPSFGGGEVRIKTGNGTVNQIAIAVRQGNQEVDDLPLYAVGSLPSPAFNLTVEQTSGVSAASVDTILVAGSSPSLLLSRVGSAVTLSAIGTVDLGNQSFFGDKTVTALDGDCRIHLEPSEGRLRVVDQDTSQYVAMDLGDASSHPRLVLASSVATHTLICVGGYLLAGTIASGSVASAHNVIASRYYPGISGSVTIPAWPGDPLFPLVPATPTVTVTYTQGIITAVS